MFFTRLKELFYLTASFFLLLGFRNLVALSRLKKGLNWIMSAIVIAGITVLFSYRGHNLGWIILAISAGSLMAYGTAGKVRNAQYLPVMAFCNAIGSAAVSLVILFEYLQYFIGNRVHLTNYLAALGIFTSTLAFVGNFCLWLKLKDCFIQIKFKRDWVIYHLLLGITVSLAIRLLCFPNYLSLMFFYGLVLADGFCMLNGVKKADLTILGAFFSTLTGIATLASGLLLKLKLIIIGGTLITTAGGVVTYVMSKTNNRALWGILFRYLKKNTPEGKEKELTTVKVLPINDAAAFLKYVKNVIIVPGYGMAIAKAHYKLAELVTLLLEKNVQVKLAVHPLAGCTLGHMNLLLSEAGIPDDYIVDFNVVNEQLTQTDVVLVVGANDIINIAARNQGSPLYQMPILEIEKANQILVIKRGNGQGYYQVPNPLFYSENCYLVYGDARVVLDEMITVIKND